MAAATYSLQELALGHSQLVTKYCLLNKERLEEAVTIIKRSSATMIINTNIIPQVKEKVSTCALAGKLLSLIITVKYGKPLTGVASTE